MTLPDIEAALEFIDREATFDKMSRRSVHYSIWRSDRRPEIPHGTSVEVSVRRKKGESLIQMIIRAAEKGRDKLAGEEFKRFFRERAICEGCGFEKGIKDTRYGKLCRECEKGLVGIIKRKDEN